MDRRIKKDRRWCDYPVGTKVHAANGGHWERVKTGWRSLSGDIFPTPGGDAVGRCVELPVTG